MEAYTYVDLRSLEFWNTREFKCLHFFIKDLGMFMILFITEKKRFVLVKIKLVATDL